MIGQAHVDTDVAMMARLCKDPRNFRARFEVPWRLIESPQGTFDWSMLDYIVAALLGYGFVPHAILWCTPAWQGAGNSLPSAVTYQAFCTAVATRYMNRIWIYEAWNEPVEGNGHYLYSAVGNTNGQNYVTNLLNPCYTAVKAVDPTAIVNCAATGS
jgi:GH35 family endo-1,4-beta-xylanase